MGKRWRAQWQEMRFSDRVEPLWPRQLPSSRSLSVLLMTANACCTALRMFVKEMGERGWLERERGLGEGSSGRAERGGKEVVAAVVTASAVFPTRKGEKRRIPNGERKRKSTGSAPENSANGAFRAVASLAKGLNGSPDAKRPQQEKMETNQSPLKESSMLNLPESKDGPSARLDNGHIPDTARMADDTRMVSPPVAPTVASDAVGDINGNTATSSSSPEHKDTLGPMKVHAEKRRHSTSPSESSSGSSSSSDSVISSSDVKVLSSSGGTTTSAIDSMSRLALYQAASAFVKGDAEAPMKPGTNVSMDTPCDTNQATDLDGEKHEKIANTLCSPKLDVKDKNEVSGGSDENMFSCGVKTELKDKKQRSVDDSAAAKHSSSRPKEHPPDKTRDRKNDSHASFDKHRHTVSHRDSLSRLSDLDAERHGRDAERRDDRRDRDADRRERDAERRERDSEQRRQEDRSPEKDRNATVTSSGSKSAFSVEKHNPAPGAEFPGAGARPEGVPTADPAAFSDYMRVLAAGHHGFVPAPTGCLPPVFPLRPPTDVSVSSAYLHPMQAAACGMFSAPTSLGLPKDPVLYPTSMAGLPTSTYGTPALTPLQLLPHQYPAAATTPVLDYPRPYPYEMDSAVDLSPKRFRLDQPLAMSLYGAGSLAPVDYMAAYRGLAAPMSCGMESSLYDKNTEYLRKRLYPELPGGAAGTTKGPESVYLASLPDYYRALYCCGCMENRPEDIRTWSVEGVAKFVSSLEGCNVYAEIFREQRVDGKILVLLTVEHLMKSLGMKLGPAVLLTERVAKLLQDSTRASGCDMCKRLANMVPALHSSVGY
ncbi:hypothetical protein BaRGS_00002502 [Batillaria attramentaria]|uniref:SAM domain-containing protein n=1 Tax=Batillaria attramentaria TaxID=370345 RepID=A0ABD0M3C3_9CAEN